MNTFEMMCAVFVGMRQIGENAKKKDIERQTAEKRMNIMFLIPECHEKNSFVLLPVF